MPVVRPGQGRAEVRREADVPTLGAEEVPGQCHSHCSQRPVVEVVTAVVTARLDVGGQTLCLAGQGSERVVEVADLARPPHEIVIADPARGPRRATARQYDIASGLVELLRDLAARLA